MVPALFSLERHNNNKVVTRQHQQKQIRCEEKDTPKNNKNGWEAN